jgi:hypothetical protein
VEQLKKNGRSMTRSITVLLNKGNDLKIEKVESDKSLFKVVTKEVKPGRMVQLSVEPILGKLKTGPNADQLKIHTNQKQAQLLLVPISFEILQADEDSDTNQYNDDMDDDDVDEDDTDEDDDELGQMGSRIHFSLG